MTNVASGALALSDPRAVLAGSLGGRLRKLADPRSAGRLALPLIGTGLLYAIDRGTVANDDYAFLDWGRELLHGSVPALEQRAFHPLPVVAAGVLSLFGSAAPTLVTLISLACLASLGMGAWRVARLLGLRSPAPALAALLVVCNPVLTMIGYSAYINMPFAALVTWALVAALEGRSPRRAWVLLIAAGLVRPEAWPLLAGYGTLRWWESRRQPGARRRLAGILGLALGPAVLWLGLEWAMFGNPLYSFINTRASVQTTSPSGVQTFGVSFGAPLLAICGLGVLVILLDGRRRAAALTLGTAILTALTLGALAVGGINTPSRHFSVLVALMCVATAAGATAPAALLASVRPTGSARSLASRRARLHGWRVARSGAVSIAVTLASCAAVLAIAIPHAIDSLQSSLAGLDVDGSTERALASTVQQVRPRIDLRRAGANSIALIGSPDGAPLAYDLGVPYDVVVTAPWPAARVIVQPSQATWRRLHQAGLDDLELSPPPGGWARIVGGAWEIYVPAQLAGAG